VLSHDGTVQLVLMNHQEDAHCSSLAEWKQSMKPALLAAHHGLLLTGFDDWTVPIPNPLIKVQMQSFGSRVLQMCISFTKPSGTTIRHRGSATSLLLSNCLAAGLQGTSRAEEDHSGLISRHTIRWVESYGEFQVDTAR
jgi:hypothetical protein